MTGIAVVGDEGFLLGFRLAGVRDVRRAETVEELGRVLSELLDNPHDVGILVLKASDVRRLPSVLQRRLHSSVTPVVLEIGGEGGGDLREKVKRAIGVDLYSS